MSIDNKTMDFDNQFIREVTIALSKTLSKSIRWINHFSDKKVRVVIPFYTNITKDERFDLDAFVDDIVGTRVQLNTDQYQRGVISLMSFASISSEFANPNEYLHQKSNVSGVMRSVISKVKAVPMSLHYDIEIKLDSYNEIDKCSQKILNTLFNYFFFNFDYYGLKIDAVLSLPDDKTIEVPQEITLQSDTKKSIKFSLEVRTYFPIFKIDIDDLTTCDNDDSFNWDYLGVPQPTNDFSKSLKSYNEAFGQTTINDEGNTEGVEDYKRVFWKVYLNYLEENKTIDPRTFGKNQEIV